MSHWSVQDAKAKFSAMLDACLTDGAQVVSRRGVDIAVIAPLDEWKRLQAANQTGLKALLLSDEARTDDLIVAPRGRLRRRAVPAG